MNPLVFWQRKKNKRRNAVKKIRKREKKTFFKKVIQFFTMHKNWLIAITWLLLIIVSITLILQRTLRSPAYTITYISFATESLDTYDDPLLYRHVAETFESRNFFVVRTLSRKKHVNTIQQRFPIIKDIRISQQADQQFLFTIEFNTPNLVFLISDWRRYASLDEHLYLLWSWNSLWSESIQLELPRYAATLRSIEWVYYAISEKRLLEIYTLIEETLWAQHITERIYLPWWSKLFLAYKGKRLYIHVDKDVNTQLQKLIDLENQYAWFSNLQIIDVWSSDDIIVR